MLVQQAGRALLDAVLHGPYLAMTVILCCQDISSEAKPKSTPGTITNNPHDTLFKLVQICSFLYAHVHPCAPYYRIVQLSCKVVLRTKEILCLKNIQEQISDSRLIRKTTSNMNGIK